MEKRIIALLISAMMPLAFFGQTYHMTVVDSITGEPLSNASVLDRNGRIIGTTSSKGVIPYVPREGFPITIRFIGYLNSTVEQPMNGRILLKESISELPEVIVESQKRPILHLLGYVREYSTLTTYSDTVFMFREKMVDFMVQTEPKKKFKSRTTPRLLSCKSYYHFRNSAGIDSVSDYFPEHFSWSDWIGITQRLALPQSLNGQQYGTDTIKKKHIPAMVWRKSDERVYLDVDVLCDTANYRFAPLLTRFIDTDMDFRRLNIRYVFDDIYRGTILADNLSSMSFSIESKGRGRNLNRILRSSDPAYVETYAEIYIIDKEYISTKEARDWESKTIRQNDIPTFYFDDVPELPSYIQGLMARVDNIDHDSIRLDTEPNQLLVSHMKKRGKKGGILRRIKSLFGRFK